MSQENPKLPRVILEVPLDSVTPHPEPAAAIRNGRDDLLRHWLDRSRQFIPALESFKDEEVLDNLPAVIDALAGALDDPEGGYANLNLVGGIHGVTRFHQRISLDDLGLEYPLLRQVLWSHVRRNLGRGMTDFEADAFNGLIDRVVHLSNAAFADLQHKELQLENDARSRHLAMLSHDVRNTLNAALLSIEMLEERLKDLTADRPDIHDLRDDLDDCRRLTSGAVQTMNRVLEAERLRAGGVRPQVRPVDLVGLLNSVRTSAARAAGQRYADGSSLAEDCEIEIDCPKGAVVHTDRDLLSTILQNLLGNAVRYACDKPVRLVAEPGQEGEWRISIIDRGPGIPQEQLDSLFTMFRRGSSPATRGREGTGLGLFICRRAADLLGAKLDVASAPGRGTRFTVITPAPSPEK